MCIDDAGECDSQAVGNDGEGNSREYKKLFLDTVTQADKGVDFDFLRAAKMVGKTPSSQ